MICEYGSGLCKDAGCPDPHWSQCYTIYVFWLKFYHLYFSVSENKCLLFNKRSDDVIEIIIGMYANAVLNFYFPKQ